MRIYTCKQLHKHGKVITSMPKKEERNVNFVTIISANAFQIKFCDLKSKKNISKTSYPKIDITENMCDHTVEY